jgi:hypothetical protein
MNTAEIIAGEVCGTAAFLGLAIGYPWLVLHYARLGVLKLAKPTEPRRAAAPENSAVAAAGIEPPAASAAPTKITREAA